MFFGSLYLSCCRSQHEEIDLISEDELLLSSASLDSFPVSVIFSTMLTNFVFSRVMIISAC